MRYIVAAIVLVLAILMMVYVESAPPHKHRSDQRICVEVQDHLEPQKLDVGELNNTMSDEIQLKSKSKVYEKKNKGRKMQIFCRNYISAMCEKIYPFCQNSILYKRRKRALGSKPKIRKQRKFKLTCRMCRIICW